MVSVDGWPYSLTASASDGVEVKLSLVSLGDSGAERESSKPKRDWSDTQGSVESGVKGQRGKLR